MQVSKLKKKIERSVITTTKMLAGEDEVERALRPKYDFEDELLATNFPNKSVIYFPLFTSLVFFLLDVDFLLFAAVL